MFPIRDHNPSERTPFVTWALIAINIGVFVSYFSLPEPALNRFFYDWGLVPAFVGHAPETVVTSMFLHGGLLHLAGNMLFLWVFGDNLEDVLGHLGFLSFYIAGGLAAAFAQYISEPSSTVPMVGASGAVAAVMGGYLVLFPRARVDILLILVIIFRVIPVPAWIVLASWFGIQLFQGTMLPTSEGGVAYWAHAGGFAAGVAMIMPAWLRRGGPRFWQRTLGVPPHPEARYRHVRTGIPRVTRRR